MLVPARRFIAVPALLAAVFLAPAAPREAIHGALAEALAAIGRTPEDLAVRDVRWFAEMVASAGQEPPFPLPRHSDTLRPPVVDVALRSPVAALDLGLDLLEGRWPEALAPFREGGRGAKEAADAGDLAGNDRYEAREKSARGCASDDKAAPDPGNPWADLGVFLDLGGTDRCAGPAGGGDGRLWEDGRTGRGVGLDR